MVPRRMVSMVPGLFVVATLGCHPGDRDPAPGRVAKDRQAEVATSFALVAIGPDASGSHAGSGERARLMVRELPKGRSNYLKVLLVDTKDASRMFSGGGRTRSSLIELAGVPPGEYDCTVTLPAYRTSRCRVVVSGEEREPVVATMEMSPGVEIVLAKHARCTIGGVADINSWLRVNFSTMDDFAVGTDWSYAPLDARTVAMSLPEGTYLAWSANESEAWGPAEFEVRGSVRTRVDLTPFESKWIRVTGDPDARTMLTQKGPNGNPRFVLVESNDRVNAGISVVVKSGDRITVPANGDVVLLDEMSKRETRVSPGGLSEFSIDR